jgi:hypothetical protein
VSARFCRGVVAVLSAFGVLGLLVLPAEHVHAAGLGDRGHREVVHRHFEPHHSPPSGAALEHGDDHHDVRWLSVAVVNAHPIYEIHRTTQVAVHVTAEFQPPLMAAHFADDLCASAHDPPWVSQHPLRGPPSCSF